MKTIIKYLKLYILDHFDIKLYISIVVFLSLCIAFNGYYDFEDSVIDSYYGKPIQFVYFFLFQAIPYYVVCLLIYQFTPHKLFIRQHWFWITSFTGMVVIALDRSIYFRKLVLESFPNALRLFAYRCIGNLSTLVIVGLLLYLFYRLVDRKTDSFYGVTTKEVNLKPYFILLLLVLPLVISASFSSDFLNQYPMYQRAGGVAASLYLGVPEWISVVIYETTYALSFFSVELFFRGFLVLGLTRFLGPYVVLPMVATYAFLHFGKPIGEIIGSIFGGYILGIVAYYSRNIWGGVMVHVGLALLMELAAYMQK